MMKLSTGYLQFVLNEFLSDCLLKVEDKTFPAHKVVLASNSVYFCELFKKSSEASVQIPDIKLAWPEGKKVVEVFNDFLVYLYSGLEENSIVERLDASSAFTLLAIALALDIPVLQEVAEKFIVIDVLNLENAAMVLKEGTSLASSSLVMACCNLITQHFEVFVTDPDLKRGLLELTVENLRLILTSDDLSITSELTVYQFVCFYIENRQKDQQLEENKKLELLKMIRWGHLSHKHLMASASNPSLAIAKDLVLEGLSAQLSNHESTEYEYKIQIVPRKTLQKFFPSKSLSNLRPPDKDVGRRLKEEDRQRSVKTLNEIFRSTPVNDSETAFKDEFSYEFDFDENGLLYYLATQGYSQKWINPHSLGEVRAFASSLSFGRIEDFVGRSGNSLRTGKDELAFLGLDLGSDRLFSPTAYTLMNSINPSYACLNWQFEASVNRSRWKVLDRRVHSTGALEQDQKYSQEKRILSKRSGTSTWALKAANEGFRYFRIVCLGQNQSGTSCVGISCIELYGSIVSGRTRK